jgi:aspartate-semialdehyde dehydrogenase
MDNIIPYVSGDEGKMETETLKILGTLQGERVIPYQAITSATATRVPVIDGHLINMSIEMAEKPSMEAVLNAWQNYVMPPEIADLPSAPERPVQYLPQIDRPQPRRDRMAGKGMMTSIGRLRECPILGYKFAAMAHNTIRGAAGCSILNAEYLAVRGYLADFRPELSVTVTS